MAPAPFSTLLLAVLLSTALVVIVEAAPWPQYAKHSTHRTHIIGRGLQVEAYHPKTSFTTFGTNGTSVAANSLQVQAAFKAAAMSYVTSRGQSNTSVAWKSGFTTGDAGYAYFTQSHNGIPFSNAVCNLAITGNPPEVVSWASSLVDLSSTTIANSTATVSWRSVLPQVEDQLGATYNNQNATLEYYVQSDGSVALTHVIQAQNNQTGAWYEAYIDAHSGQLVSVTDFVAHSSFTVLPITEQNFESGLQTLTDPEDLSSSPFGWNNIGNNRPTTTTSGNNVVAFIGNQISAQTSPGLNFNSVYDDTQSPQVASNMAAATTNAFYILNTMHDVAYRYGFTESAFNFQVDNNGNGGVGGDRVQMSVQDASGTNNANFATPPDGQSGQCRMFIWTLTATPRDGTMENDIMIHEFTHGITNRMTGGGTGRCLQTLEAGGLGEGWSDTMADWVSQTSNQTQDFALGKYVLNQPQGIRTHPYSTDPQTNPLRYSNLQTLNEIHAIGEVWANMLHNVYASLVSNLGFNPDKLTTTDGPEGNIVFMKLFMGSLTAQPCNPTFVQSRDAWIQADQNLFNGTNKCTLFNAFASRGLGLNADDTFTDDTTVPAGC